MPVELVIHCRGVKDEIVSPETYSTAAEAATDLASVHDAIEAGEAVVRLPWFSGAATNIICAHVRDADLSRGSNPTLDELVERMERLMGFAATEDPSR